MESWYLLSMHKSSLLVFLMLLVFVVGGTLCGVSIEEDERKALLAIKESLQEVSDFINVDYLLPSWVDDNGGEYCDWERIKCNTTSRYVTNLSLSNIFSLEQDRYDYYDRLQESKMMVWPLDFSLFLHFKELTSLDLSWSYIGNTGLEGLSGLKKLEILNLSTNFIETNIFRSLVKLTSLKTLDLSYMNRNGYYAQDYSPAHDISIFQSLENLEVLDLTWCGFYGSLQMQVTSALGKLKVLNVGDNFFNESFVASLSVLPSLKALDLSENKLSGSFPSQELSHLTHLETLDLSYNGLNVTPTIQGCKSMVRLVSLESVSLGGSDFNKSIISCLSFLPSLKILDLSDNYDLGSSFPIQELSFLRELETLDMGGCKFQNFPAINGTMSNLLHLDLGLNNFFSGDDVMRSMAAFPSLRSLSLDFSFQGGRLSELPNLPDLEVLILSTNYFNGIIPMEALATFQHLKLLDLSYNNFIGGIPPAIKSLSSLQTISLAGNMLTESSSLKWLCELKNLNEMDLSQNMFDGNMPYCFNRLSSLKLFDISSNRFSGRLLPSLISNLTSLEYVDFSHNQFEGVFPLSSFANHKMLEYVAYKSDNDKFQVETEEPIGWTPMFLLKGLVLSNCKINNTKGNVALAFLLHQYKLTLLDMSHNSLDGQFLNWLLKNNPMLEFLSLRANSFDNTFSMPFYRIPNMRSLDISSSHIIGAIPIDIQKVFPNLFFLNLSTNSLEGIIPSSVGDLLNLRVLDLSHNGLSGEVPASLFGNDSNIKILILSNNSLHGNILSGNVNLGEIDTLQLDSNCFTGEIGNISTISSIKMLDISNNFFTGLIPGWVSNSSSLIELVVRNNSFGGQFPCVSASFEFLDISENDFSGPIPSCLNLQNLRHLHLGSNRFTGLIPSSFYNLTGVLTLDISNNKFSGRIPEFLGELSNLRILVLRKNNFTDSIPKELCKLTNASMIDLSGNLLSGSIPKCLQYLTGPSPSDQAFMQHFRFRTFVASLDYRGGVHKLFLIEDGGGDVYDRPDAVLFTSKALPLLYKGRILNLMSGLDLSCNKLSGVIPEELGLLTHIRVLNMSHNKLIGPIPMKFSNLANIESLDLSFNQLTGQVPSELIKLHSLAVFNVSFNNLSGRLPEMKAQFSTFENKSYTGNPLLCGLPLVKKCTTESHGTHPSNEEESDEKWHDISFYASSSSIWLGFVLGFAAALYVNHYWRRRWLDFVEDCTYACYFFLFELVRKVSLLFRK